jgi:hypothetical protein
LAKKPCTQFTRREEDPMDNPPPWTDPFCWSTMNEPWTEADDVIEEIRQIRMEISARFDHDIHKYAAYLMEQQKRHGDRLVDPRTWREGESVRDSSSRITWRQSGEQGRT